VPIRLRVAAVFTLALALALALGSWLLISQLRSVVLRSVDAGLAAQLTQAGRLLSHPGGTGSGGTGSGLPPGDYILQLIDGKGQVKAASEDAGTTPLLTRAQQRQARHGRITLDKKVDDDQERVMAAALSGRPGWVAVAGTSLESADSTVSAVVIRLVVGGSVFVIVAGLGAYLLARAALAPVERLRRKAASLSERDKAQRLPVPATKDEIAALAGTMNGLLARLHDALARQRTFVADASHELRTPFAVLSAELELASKPGRSREELAAAVASAAEETTRLRRLTDDLLFLARSDEDRLAIRPAPVGLAALLSGSIQQARGRAASAGVTCVLDVPPGLIAQVDADQIRRAVDNLVDNALRFAPDGTQIEVSAQPAASCIAIEVADAGPGFPPEYLPAAFERFSRPRTRRNGDAGAGLGLSIVQAIAQAHGGTVTIANRPGSGAVVRIELPRAGRG
jgi:heavy metal sensor kinase